MYSKETKQEAQNLLNQGLSYRQIQKRLGTALSTLSSWFGKNSEYLAHQKQSHQKQIEFKKKKKKRVGYNKSSSPSSSYSKRDERQLVRFITLNPSATIEELQNVDIGDHKISKYYVSKTLEKYGFSSYQFNKKKKRKK